MKDMREFSDGSNDLKKRIDNIHAKLDTIDETIIQKQLQSFRIEYTHHSTAIEGNTLSLVETKCLLEDAISVGGKKLRELYEIINHDKAYEYLLSIAHKEELSEKIVKDLHSIVTENIIVGGIYRDCAVRITGAGFRPPVGFELQRDLQNFYADFSWRKNSDPIEYAAWTHAEFVRIHPFPDGNGRTARLLLNYQLLHSGYLPVIVKVNDRLKYYEALDKYGTEKDLFAFYSLTEELEIRQIEEYEELLDSKRQ